MVVSSEEAAYHTPHPQLLLHLPPTLHTVGWDSMPCLVTLLHHTLLHTHTHTHTRTSTYL